MSPRRREFAGMACVCLVAACGSAPAQSASETTAKPWPQASGAEASQAGWPTPPPASGQSSSSERGLGPPSPPPPPPAPAPPPPQIATLDPTQPMPTDSVTTHATLVAAQPASIGVDSRSDVYSASLPEAAQRRGGVLPAELALAPGGGYVVFTQVHGRIGCKGRSAYSADGGDCAKWGTHLNAADHVSGIVDGQRTLFLTGVFLGSQPGSAPAGLDFSDSALSKSRQRYEPQLGQSFFIGDGLTGTGTGDEQHFVIPQGATALYIGFADGFSFRGDPGWYSDNTGSVAFQVTQNR